MLLLVLFSVRGHTRALARASCVRLNEEEGSALSTKLACKTDSKGTTVGRSRIMLSNGKILVLRDKARFHDDERPAGNGHPPYGSFAVRGSRIKGRRNEEEA